MSQKVSVLLPAYNEGKDIDALLRRINSSLSNSSLDYKILVVDDGSTDETAELVNALAAEVPVRLVSHKKNKGLGSAIATGFSELAREDSIVVTMDADNTQDPSLIPALVAEIEKGADFAIASRFVPGGKMIGVGFGRSILSYGASLVFRTLFPIKGVRDYSCGYRAYSQQALGSLRDKYGNSFLKECGFACMVELLLKLRTISAKGAEVPLVLRYDFKHGDSKMKVFRTILRYGAVVSRDLRAGLSPSTSYRVAPKLNS